jgi:cellulose synthase/poly-beta-1,6-N-acetylglucosamine synthase-like glycosyltransferase
MPVVYFVLILALGTVAYVLIGYPLILAATPRKTRRPVAKDLAYSSTVSVILAVYNGAEFIRAKLESILALDYPPDLLQIIVVSDGSSDGTEAIVREFSHRGVQLLVIPHSGKASALNAAFALASGEILFFTDVRQMLDRAALRHLVANFADPTIGAVTGEMRLLKGHLGEQADMDLYWRYEVWTRKRHSSIDSILAVTGCIWAMRRKLASPLPPGTLTDDAVMPLTIFFQGYRVIFDPAAIATDYPAKTGTEFRRKCRTLAGLWQVVVSMPQLFTSRNRMRLHFLSHKFGRLVLPWAILLAVAATVALPPTSFRSWMIGNECALMLLALLDGLVPRWLPFKRITSPARTFLTMNAASIAALAVFFTSPDRFWAPTRVEKVDP